MTSVFIRRGKFGDREGHRDIQGREGHMKTEAEIRVMLAQGMPEIAAVTRT